MYIATLKKMLTAVEEIQVNVENLLGNTEAVRVEKSWLNLFPKLKTECVFTLSEGAGYFVKKSRKSNTKKFQ